MNKIKELRNERGLSTRSLAEEMDWSAMAISYYENKKRDLNTDALIKLAKYFEVTCDYLLGVSTYCLFALYFLHEYQGAHSITFLIFSIFCFSIFNPWVNLFSWPFCSFV